MSVKKRQQRAQRRSRERIRTYLYGSDREGTSRSAASFAGGGSGAVSCGQP